MSEEAVRTFAFEILALEDTFGKASIEWGILGGWA